MKANIYNFKKKLNFQEIKEASPTSPTPPPLAEKKEKQTHTHYPNCVPINIWSF